MKYVKTCKAIRMEGDTEKFLSNTLEVLQKIDSELETIAQEDEYFSSLESECWTACAALEDFIESFKAYAKGEDD